MNKVILVLSILLFSQFSLAEVVLRDGFISPQGVKTGVKVSCQNEALETSVKTWFEDYERLIKKFDATKKVEVTKKTGASGLVVITLDGHDEKVHYSLQPSSGCGVNSFIQSI